MQIVLINLRLGQQRRHAQRAARILRPQKLVLPCRILQRLLIMQPAPLLSQQLRHGIHAVGSVKVPRRRMIHGTKPVHRPRIVCPSPAAFGNRLQRLASRNRPLPRSRHRVHTPRRCLGSCRHVPHHYAAQNRRANPTPTPITSCLHQALHPLKFRRSHRASPVKRSPVTPADTPGYRLITRQLWSVDTMKDG